MRDDRCVVGFVRCSRLRRAGEDEFVPVYDGRLTLRGDEVQTATERGTGRSRRNCRLVQALVL